MEGGIGCDGIAITAGVGEAGVFFVDDLSFPGYQYASIQVRPEGGIHETFYQGKVVIY
jgi:hypothetical protein